MTLQPTIGGYLVSYKGQHCIFRLPNMEEVIVAAYKWVKSLEV